MSYKATVYKVMIASPGDVKEERRIIRKVIADWNSAHSEINEIVLMPVGWETSVPEMGDRPQEIINKRILKGCDILVGILWTKLGTPTGVYDSGTVEEIEEHLKANKQTMLYFSNAPVNPNSLNPEQYEKVTEFKNSCQKRGLYQPYDSIDEFKELFSQHIQSKMNQDEYRHQNSGSTSKGINEPNTLTQSNLSEEAKSLLKAASQDPNGLIRRLPVMGGGIMVQSNRKHFGGKNPRQTALIEAAIEELELKGLIQQQGSERQSFKITNKGYSLADSKLE